MTKTKTKTQTQTNWINMDPDVILETSILTADGKTYVTHTRVDKIDTILEAPQNASYRCTTTRNTIVLLRPADFASARFIFTLPKDVQDELKEDRKALGL